MSGARHWEQDKESTVYVGNIDERCSDALVWELMAQAGPVINVHLPKDRVSQTHQGFGFVEYGNEDDAEYAVKIMNQIRVWHKPLRVNKASTDKRGENGAGLGGGNGVGAELFIGNLDPMADEKTLYDTFSRFGPLVAVPKVARDDANLSKGYGFVSYASFEASDEAIEHMHGQYMMNKEITVQYAYKKDGKGERHGDAAERALASQGRKNGVEVAIPALPAALVMPNNTPSAPAAMIGYTVPLGLPNAVTGVPPRLTPQPPPAYAGYGYGAPPALTGFGQFPAPTATVSYGYQHAPPQAPPPSRQYNPSPLQAPPSNAGLPARPPPSYGGYGGPYNFPGMQQPFPRQGGPPASFPAFSGMQPPSSLPPLPANMPPGYQPPPPPAGFGSAAPPAGVGSAAPPAGFGSGAPQ